MPNETTPFTQIEVTKSENAEATITGEISLEAIDRLHSRAVQRLGENVELPGFRKGHVPEAMLVKHLGEEQILSEIAMMALQEGYPSLLAEHALQPVTQPAITLTKLAPGNPIGFKIETALMPTFDLPDYTAIAAEAVKKVDADESAEVTDADVDEALQTIRKNFAHAKWHEEHPEDHSHEHEFKDEDLPTLDDAFAQKLGAFNTVQELREALSRQIAHEKKARKEEKVRVAIADALVEKTPVPVPGVFVESEIGKMRAEFEATVQRMGIVLDEYLAKVNKTEDQIKEEWRPEAKKRAQLQFILSAIAQKESIEPDPEKAEREVRMILDHYKDADQENVRAYVDTMLTNAKVFEMLSNESK